MLKLRERQEKKSRLFWYNLFKLGSVKFNNPCNLDENFKLTPIGFERNYDGDLIFDANYAYIKKAESASPSLIYMAQLKLNSLSSKIDIPEYVSNDFVIKISFEPNIYYPYNENKNRYDLLLEKTNNEKLKYELEQAKKYKEYYGYNNEIEFIPGYPGIKIMEDYPNTSLLYESRIYRHVINDLIQKRYTPNLLLYVISFRCSNFLTSKFIKEDKYMQNYLKQLSAMNVSELSGEKKFDINKAIVLILERGKGKTLNDYLVSDVYPKKDSLKNLKMILIQCLYTLEVFSQVELQHQDSHFNNIWAEKLDEMKPLYYFYDVDKCLNVNLEWMIKFFDWDRGFSNELRKKDIFNRLGSDYLCFAYGQCNEKQKLFDLTKFLCYFFNNVRQAERSVYEEIKKFYIRIVKFNKRLFELITVISPKYSCLLCKDVEKLVKDKFEGTDSNKNQVITILPGNTKTILEPINYCDTKTIFDDIIENSKMMTITEMLNDPFFDEFRISPENIPFSELFSKEEIYYLPSIEEQVQTQEKRITTTKRKELEDKIISIPSMEDVVGFTETDTEEFKIFNKDLIDILDKKLSPKEQKEKLDKLRLYWKDNIKNKRYKEKSNKGYIESVYDYIFN
jgi:hypothetical protein